MQSMIGTKVGRYRIVRLLGVGGMGEVYQAEDEGVGRTVAVKVLRRLSRDPDRLERFYNEARIHARLYHPNIAAMLEACETPQGPSIVMEYVPGVTLAERIDRDGPLPWREAARLFHEIARAVGYLHANGVRHRDITPNNIKLTPQNRIKLLDFGLARDAQSTTLTQIGNVAGTTVYLSPEQATGGTADTRSDVWSLGILFHTMLIGQPPFQANDTTELWNQLQSAGYPGLRSFDPAMPEWCDRVISRCLRLRPGRRFQTAGEIASHLDRRLVPVSRRKPVLRAALRSLSARVRSDWRFLLPAGSAPVVLALPVALALYIGAASLGAETAEPPATPTSTRLEIDRVATRPAMPTPLAITFNAAPRKVQLAEVRIGSSGAPLEVWCQGRRLGVAAAQPVTFTAEVGATLPLVLRRVGETDRLRSLTVAPLGNDYDY